MVTNSKRARRAVRSGSRRMSDQERMQNRKRPADQKQDQKPVVKKEDAPASAGAAAVGIGWFGGVGAVSSGRSSQTALAQWAEANASIRQNQEEMLRLTSDMR